jgi:hypothetical protein
MTPATGNGGNGSIATWVRNRTLELAPGHAERNARGNE